MNRRLVGLSTVAALLGGVLVVQQMGSSTPAGDGAGPAPGAAATAGRTVKLNALEDLDPEAFTAIVERPLFNPSRQPRPAEPVAPPQPQVEQPPPPPPPPAPQGPGPDDYKLLGVSSGPDGRIAALKIAATGDVIYLRQGESVDSWSVIDVGDRSIAIGTPENPVTFGLFADTDAAPEDGAEPVPGMPPQGQPLPLPLPLPMPQLPKPPGLPEQHTVPDTGG